MLNTYQEAIAYIHGLPKFHRTNNLDNIKKALHELGDPQNSYETIHVTGTNGKGTTSNFLANLFEADGKRVGLFISPYVKVFNERIQINHQNIPNDDLLKTVNYLITKIGEISLAEFEFVTVLGYYYFRDRVDIAVIEAGIGARHDKTNVIVPQVSVITSIDLDHEKLIGPTLRDIAFEKAGIIKPQKPIVTGFLQTSVSDIIEDAASQNESLLLRFGQNFDIKKIIIKNLKISFTYYDDKVTIEDIHCDGFEKTTVMNAAIAIQAFIQYKRNHNQTIDSELIKASLDKNHLLGRAQIVQKQPLIMMDGAHNISAVYNLINSLNTIYENKDIIVLYAGMKDKDRSDILEELTPKVKHVYVTTLDMQRSADMSDYDLASYNNVTFVENYHQELQKIIESLTDQQMLLITGSFYLISELENYFA
ncbi:bifunctional folylpolyglutamate synthase/dihydrofolate synthase [Companilactobacillus suantsaicola]|uniref:tetrahydrofolate synthase n=1 Tax=Companilactobacillus suantsaicola TaxID=2487723 RepID=A0A4Z0JSS9_9LACO|nr:cyanophycin synthetase [Companilactobacillus suantsaicola]TGD25306.1 bifunctional folylpolyglutamate synthase/dihydrofolate synthase [Companilactobacillus suantsaicola]